MVIPVYLKIFSVAAIGPSNIATGSLPATAILIISALGLRPNFLRPFSLHTIMQEAPSAIYEAKPAVRYPVAFPFDVISFIGFNFCNAALLVPFLIPSSLS